MKRVAFDLLSVAFVLISRSTSAATFVTLPPIPGLSSNSSTQYNGIDGNNVVGSYSDASGSHGFLYDGSGFVTLDDPLANGLGTLARGISGQNIVGNYWDASNRSHGFLFDGSNYHTIDYPGAGFTGLTAISGNKMVGFYHSFVGGVDHSFIYDGSTFTPLDDPLAANDLGGTSAFGISGNKVVGSYVDATHAVRSFLFDGTNYSDLISPGAPPTSAYGIDGNNIVGTFDGPHSFLYNDLTQTFTELDYPGAVLTTAYGISGNRIVGHYETSFESGESFGFVATIPEPSSLVIVLGFVGLGLIGLVRRRCRAR